MFAMLASADVYNTTHTGLAVTTSATYTDTILHANLCQQHTVVSSIVASFTAGQTHCEATI